MSSMPGVTAVVPTHDRPQLMRRAVQSICDQQYDGPVEIIVVFDATPVDTPTPDLPEGWTIRGVANTRSRGLAGARNTGIAAARNDYVAFLDDDDHWLPGKLSAQIDAFLADDEVGLVGTGIVVDDGTRTHERLIPVEDVTYDALLADRMAGLHSSTFVFKASTLREIGMVDENLPGSYGEDYDLLLRTATHSRIAVVNRPLVSVTWAGQSYFFGQWRAFADGLQYLLRTHPGFAHHRKAYAHHRARVGFALAAAGDRRAGRRWAVLALRGDPTQVKAWLALAVALRMVSSDRVISTVQRFGKGI